MKSYKIVVRTKELYHVFIPVSNLRKSNGILTLGMDKFENRHELVRELYINLPNLEVGVKSTDYIDQHVENVKPILIHSNAWSGRTGGSHVDDYVL